MSRMASLSLSQTTIPAPILLCLLIGFLSFHFLAEDSFLLQTGTPFSTEASLTFDETEHQDDLVLSLKIPERTAAAPLPTTFDGIARQQHQFCFPIITPPKVFNKNHIFQPSLADFLASILPIWCATGSIYPYPIAP